MLRTLVAVLLLICGLWSSSAFAPAGLLTTTTESKRGVVEPTPLRASLLDDDNSNNNHHHIRDLRQTAARAVATASLTAAALLLSPGTAAHADGQTKEFKFPPIDFSDKQRCVLKSSSMGQANAARDSLFDLRQCQLSGVKASGYDLSGAVMSKTDASKADFREAYFSKGYLRDSNFEGADFSNAIVDRATFQGSSLRGAIFSNAVLTGTSFEGADVEGVDFTEAAIGTFDLRNLCKNPTLKGENPATGMDTRLSAGCK